MQGERIKLNDNITFQCGLIALAQTGLLEGKRGTSFSPIDYLPLILKQEETLLTKLLC